MALELNDLMALKQLGEGNMSPYEQFKTQHMQSKSHTGGVAITGLVTGVVGTALAVGAWIFGPMYGNAKARQAREAAQSAKDLAAVQYTAALQLMNQQNQDTKANIDRILLGLQRETDARVNGDITLNATINDTVSGQQASTLTAQQQAELAASQVATQQVMTGLMTGRYSENPQRVALYRDATPCPCPASGCGCGCNG